MGRVHFKDCPGCKSTDIAFYKSIEDFGYSHEVFELFRCNACTLIFTQDQPDASDIAPYYNAEGYVMHTDTRKGLFYKLYHLARQIMLKKKLSLIKNLGYDTGKLLDIGSGTGYFAGFMKNEGWEVIGIETDEDARELASNKFGIISLDNNELKNLPNNNFQVITLWHVLEHVHNFHNYLALMHEKLNDNGVVLIAVPNHTSYDAQIYNQHWEGWDVPRHLWHFNPKAMETIVTKNQFKLVDTIPLTFDPFYNSILSERNKKTNVIFKYIKGLTNGLKSYLHANNHPKKGSSVIYILKKEA